MDLVSFSYSPWEYCCGCRRCRRSSRYEGLSTVGRHGSKSPLGNAATIPPAARKRQDDATQRRRMRNTVKQSRLLPVRLAHDALVPALKPAGFYFSQIANAALALNEGWPS